MKIEDLMKLKKNKEKMMEEETNLKNDDFKIEENEDIQNKKKNKKED
jgi:hypothetical protein